MNREPKTVRSRRTAVRVMVARVAMLHTLITCSRLPDATEDDHLAIDALVARMWGLGMEYGITPHTCLDRYCHCHTVLAEGEPSSLFGEPHRW
jgi:hypothetical protein